MSARTANEDYDALLAGGHLERTAEVLRAEAPRGAGALLLLRPRLVPRSTYERACAAARLVHRAVRACADRLRADAALRREVCRLPPEVDDRLAAEASLGHPDPVCRLDGLVGDEVTFLELNGSSGGLLKSARLAALFRALPIARAFAERRRFRDFDLAARLFAAICAVHRGLGHDGPPRFALIGARGLAADRTGEAALFRADVSARGATVTVGEWDELSYAGRTLRLGAEPVTCLLFYEPTATGLAIVERAQRDGAAWSLIGLRSLLVGSKAILALLSDPATRGLVEPGLAQAAARHLPWTRLLRDGATDHHGAPIDLLPFVAQHRERFALKPAHGSGGDGVVLGWETDAARWRAVLELTKRRSYVVQERVELPVERFPVLDGDRAGHEELAVDLGPLVWADGEVEGGFVRATRSAMLNLGRGQAATTPLWVVED